MDPEYGRRLLRQQNGRSPLNNSPCLTGGRHFSPVSSPSRDKYGDRFIPSRTSPAWHLNFNLVQENSEPMKNGGVTRDASVDSKEGMAYQCLLRNELLGAEIEDLKVYWNFPLFCFSQRLLRSPRKSTRKISKIPFKVLDAPELQDDFYLNLVDWSGQNILSVGLGTCVYLWSACTSQVTKLCDLAADGDSVTSVSWSERSGLVAVGTHKGLVQIWDAGAQKRVSTIEGHTARVGALAWNGDMLSSGSRDRLILQRDVRTPNPVERRLIGHRQELQHGLLSSGGGTADRCIRFWNTLTGQPLQCVDTGSQVCNLAWSKHSNELVSTHGYSQNQILVWKYPSLTQVAKLTGHSFRVLYLAVSPDGEAIVTGAGDETLRFWNVFNKARSHKESKSELNLFSRIR
ncbi:PREDICTED: fizzy-related protein homolog [Acropora digitifera]|uniref:fizzy-related protein homolog n=1 Tax=Acropora digitifera TaxID=70779 RepID=UPI00077A1478|nr:PREDICTED: fizzy-related protein homolog [Acropora digitifera]